MQEDNTTKTELQDIVDSGQAMKRLLDSDDFKLVFTKGFIENWALTQIHNVSVYEPSSRGAVMEQMLARSIFSVYCEDVIDAGNIALDDLRSEKEAEVIDTELA